MAALSQTRPGAHALAHAGTHHLRWTEPVRSSAHERGWLRIPLHRPAQCSEDARSGRMSGESRQRGAIFEAMEPDVQKLIQQGRVAFDRRNYADALAAFREVLRRHPNFADTRHLAGLCLSLL